MIIIILGIIFSYIKVPFLFQVISYYIVYKQK
jgi:hypothetical protein